MPSPLAHAVSGYVFSHFLPSPSFAKNQTKGWKIATFTAVFVAVFADVDFIPQILTAERFHREITHSIPFAILVCFFLAYGLSTPWKTSKLKLWTWLFCLYSSHLILDWMTQGKSGLPLFWGLSDRRFQSPWPLFPAIHHERGLWDPSYLSFLVVELVYTAFLLVCLFWTKQDHRNPLDLAFLNHRKSTEISQSKKELDSET